MSEVKQKIKKRSSFNKPSRYEMPDWVKADKKFGYRFIKEEKVMVRSDGVDPRGWEKARIPEGEPGAGEYLRIGEHVLAKMPMEDIEERKAAIAENTKIQTEAVLGAQAELADRTSHEFRNLGGKLKLNVSLD